MIYKRQGLLLITYYKQYNYLGTQSYTINIFSVNDTNILGNKYQKNIRTYYYIKNIISYNL